MIAPSSLNTTGSLWEEYVDNFMSSIEDKVSRLEKFSQSVVGKSVFAQVQTISSITSAFILGRRYPVTVLTSACLGTIVRSFSPEQVEGIKFKFTKISEMIPLEVKALAVVVSLVYFPIVFPVAAGILAGSDIGSKISPFTLAKNIDACAASLPVKIDYEIASTEDKMEAPNATGTFWEAITDKEMTKIDKKVDQFKEFCESPDGKVRIAMLQMISSVAACAILALAHPIVVSGVAVFGLVARSFSPEQLEGIKEKLGRISETLPTGVKGLAVVIAVTYARVLFPITAGLMLGFRAGAQISPYTLADGMDKMAETMAPKDESFSIFDEEA